MVVSIVWKKVILRENVPIVIVEVLVETKRVNVYFHICTLFSMHSPFFSVVFILNCARDEPFDVLNLSLHMVTFSFPSMIRIWFSALLFPFRSSSDYRLVFQLEAFQNVHF